MSDSVNCLTGTNTVCIISILDIIKGLQLPTLFPDQSMAQVVYGIALGIVSNRFVAIAGEQILPIFVPVSIFYAFLPKMSMERTMLL